MRNNSLRRLAAAVVSTFYQLAWAAWFGGMITLGAVSAPGIFRSARQWPDPASADTVLRFAGIAVGEGFRRFNTLAVICGVVLVAFGLAQWWLDPRRARLHVARLIAAGLCLAITLWLAFRVLPEMDALRAAGEAAQFDALHQLYERWSQFQVWLLLGIAVLSVALWLPDPEIVAPSGRDLGDVLLANGAIRPLQLLQARARHHGIGAVDLDTISVDPAAVATVPAELARRLTVIPIRATDETLVVAVADPTDPLAAGALREVAGSKIQTVLAERESIRAAIERHYA